MQILRSKRNIGFHCQAVVRITIKNKEYCERVKRHLDSRQKIWLFAECIPKRKKSNILQRANDVGYDEFWYLYEWDNKDSQGYTQVPMMEDYITKLQLISYYNNE